MYKQKFFSSKPCTNLRSIHNSIISFSNLANSHHFFCTSFLFIEKKVNKKYQTSQVNWVFSSYSFSSNFALACGGGFASLRSLESQFHRFHFSRALIVEFWSSLQREKEKKKSWITFRDYSTQLVILIEFNFLCCLFLIRRIKSANLENEIENSKAVTWREKKVSG